MYRGMLVAHMRPDRRSESRCICDHDASESRISIEPIPQYSCLTTWALVQSDRLVFVQSDRLVWHVAVAHRMRSLESAQLECHCQQPSTLVLAPCVRVTSATICARLTQGQAGRRSTSFSSGSSGGTNSTQEMPQVSALSGVLMRTHWRPQSCWWRGSIAGSALAPVCPRKMAPPGIVATTAHGHGHGARGGGVVVFLRVVRFWVFSPVSSVFWTQKGPSRVERVGFSWSRATIVCCKRSSGPPSTNRCPAGGCWRMGGYYCYWRDYRICEFHCSVVTITIEKHIPKKNDTIYGLNCRSCSLDVQRTV